MECFTNGEGLDFTRRNMDFYIGFGHQTPKYT